MTDPAQPDTPEDRETMRRDFERGVYEREESQPVEATPLVDSAEWENSLQCSTFVVTSEFARHLERTLSLAIRQLSLAQTENAGHIRIEDELKAELREAEKDAARLRDALRPFVRLWPNTVSTISLHVAEELLAKGYAYDVTRDIATKP